MLRGSSELNEIGVTVICFRMAACSDSYCFKLDKVMCFFGNSCYSYYYYAGVVVAFAVNVTFTGNFIFDCDMASYWPLS